MNKITIIGNVVHTPQMRTTQSGINVCSFSVAVRRRFKNPQSGEYDTDFFDVQAWRQTAEACEKWLEKGKKVAVVGAMQSRDYEKDGVKKRVWEVVADEVEFFLSPKSEGGEAAQPAPKQTKQTKSAPAPQFTVAEDEDLPF